jgi:hypothetical protein
MKTSNQLLIALLAIIFIGIISTNMVLKSEFERIDQSDPFHGYSRESVSSFKVVKLEGTYQGLVQMIPGDSFEILVSSHGKGGMQWEVKGDTLMMTHPSFTLPQWLTIEQVFHRTPSFYIMAPQLSEVHSRGMMCKLSDWQLEALQLTQEGNKSGITIAKSSIADLKASVSKGSLLQLETDNQIQYAQIAIRDSSTLLTQKQAIDSLDLQVDSTAYVKLPGSLFRQLIP